ncbi:PREDICTED: thioredoxin reductase 1, cytoplasmic-like [Cercocebus atys]|uniref:thioredoxin reductase 1, cytoplasmic-like n=1 Tax=Cercocebus atys TaxID=9531 RepID=UPI0005F54BFE|nr:PREDICTED: thioredoxin reductase 1, cytoplasmic-like [Cercocebus atys]
MNGLLGSAEMRRNHLRSKSKDHHPGKTLPENPAGFTSTATADLRALLQAYIDGHSVVIFSRSTCTRCAEVKKLFKSLCVPYFVLELDQTVKSLLKCQLNSNLE